jgi:DNA invertase Pin-like site-specific DNA recombinase
VVVWRLDRWGRSLSDLVGTLRELTDPSVGFVSLTEVLDLTTPAGGALAGMVAVFAEFEREVLREGSVPGSPRRGERAGPMAARRRRR